MNKRKEELYIIAIKNLVKEVNFLRLTDDLEKELISDDEFESELKDNSNKYVIDLLPLENKSDVDLIKDIINKIGNNDYSVDDVGQLFSIDTIKTNPFI